MAKGKIIKRKGLFFTGCILYCAGAIFSYMNVMKIHNGTASKLISPAFFVINGFIAGVAVTMIYAAIRKNKIVKILYWYLITCSILMVILGSYQLLQSI